MEKAAIVEIIIATSVFLAIIAGHWTPWYLLMPFLCDDRNELRRVPSYTFGVGCILSAFSVWALMNGKHDSLYFLIALVVAAGAGTVTTRIVEWVGFLAKGTPNDGSTNQRRA